MLQALLRAKSGSSALISRLSRVLLNRIASYIDESPSTRNPRLLFREVPQWRFLRIFKIDKYSHRFFEQTIPWKPAYENLAKIIYEWAKPSTACDIGCGTGYLIYFLSTLGVAVYGYDKSPETLDFIDPTLKDRVSILDLSIRQSLLKCDLCVCTEVAEHIPKRFSNVLIGNVAGCARSHIFFTAAHPGQGGTGHINCQKQKYWIDLFYKKGWRYQSKATNRLIQRVKEDAEISKSLPWLADNIMLFEPVS